MTKCTKPHLELATTRQLLEELKTRGQFEASQEYYTEQGSEVAIGADNLLNSLPGSMLGYRRVVG